MRQFVFKIHRSYWISAAIGALVSSSAPSLAQELSPEVIASMQGGSASAESLQSLRMSNSIGRPAVKAAPISEIPDATGSAASVPGFPSSLKPFGHQLFTRAAKYVSPTDLPVPADYIVGVGDTVEIRYFGKENKIERLLVERDGSITLTGIGPVSVAGLTLENMGKLLLERIAKQKIGVDATISMGPMRSIQIYLMGDVNNPGAVTTDALTTVGNALQFAGGIKQSGSMRRIEVRRQGKVISRVDLYDSLLNGTNQGELRLQSGDVVFVPKAGKRVGIDGEITRPAVYELLNEKSVEDLARLAGGFRPTAYLQTARLNRVGHDWQRSGRVQPLSTAAQRAMALQDGDIIDIPGVVETLQPTERDYRFKTVRLEGSFVAPGSYEWQPGLHLGRLIGRFDQLELDAFRPMAVVDRVDLVTGTRFFESVNLIDVIRNGKNVPLLQDDRVFMLSQSEVEYLSGADVQQVLAGKLPGPASSRAKGVIINADAARANAEDLAASTRKASDIGGTQKSDRGAMLGESNQCRGLIELSHIVANEGTDRFRSALFAGAYSEDGKHLVKAVPCPAVFDSHPRLLPFLLENAITLRGEVKDPGVLPIPPGFSLDMALRARGGLTRFADRNGIEINQLREEGNRATVVRVRMADDADLASLTVEPGYIVQVRKRASEQVNGLVKLSGEVTHPGSYEIRRGEKLSELIARAGGLSQFAYPYGTVFLRQSIKEEKKQYYQRAAMELQNGMLLSMSRQRVGVAVAPAAGAADMTGALVRQMREIDPIGRMVVEADPSTLEKQPSLDVQLEGGDEIYVPRKPSTILVMGEVLNPGAVQFEGSKGASDYIAAVGGLNRVADEGRIFAILPNGSAEPVDLSFWSMRTQALPPGSTIYVSREPYPSTTSDSLLLALQVVKDMALAAASLVVISK